MAFSGPGGVAQLGERLNGIQEVRGSIPLASIGYVLPLDPPETSLVAGRLLIAGSAGIAQLVEHNLAKVGVAGSSPVSRSKNRMWEVGGGMNPSLINSDL